MRGYRKFTVIGGTVVLAFVLALMGKLTPEFATVASVACGAFGAANAVEHLRREP